MKTLKVINGSKLEKCKMVNGIAEKALLKHGSRVFLFDEDDNLEMYGQFLKGEMITNV